MPSRVAGIPHHGERASLQSIKNRNWVVQADLYPAGKGTIATLLDPAGVVQFRITHAGKAALTVKIPTGR
jgi:hypothetical protein